jgi:hypothetical protein
MTVEFIKETFMALITADLYIVIAAVFGICFALKMAKFFDDRFIPIAAVVTGMGLELGYFALSGGNVVEAVCKGIICGMAAVYIANIIKQIGKK